MERRSRLATVRYERALIASSTSCGCPAASAVRPTPHAVLRHRPFSLLFIPGDTRPVRTESSSYTKHAVREQVQLTGSEAVELSSQQRRQGARPVEKWRGRTTQYAMSGIVATTARRHVLREIGDAIPSLWASTCLPCSPPRPARRTPVRVRACQCATRGTCLPLPLRGVLTQCGAHTLAM